MTEFIFIHDLVNPATGKTYKQENLEKPHNIPIGTLVEVKFDEWFEDGACWKVHARLWVVQHSRDCDGTPLYSLSQWRDVRSAFSIGPTHRGFGEESLTVIEITEGIEYGEDALEWSEDEKYGGL